MQVKKIFFLRVIFACIVSHFAVYLYYKFLVKPFVVKASPTPPGPEGSNGKFRLKVQSKLGLFLYIQACNIRNKLGILHPNPTPHISSLDNFPLFLQMQLYK